MIDWNSPQTRLALQEIKTYAELYGRGSRLVRSAYVYRRLRNSVYYGLQQRWEGLFHRPHLDSGRLHILLHLRGGLGDACAHWVAVQALRQHLPDAVFYYYTDSPHAARLLAVPDGKNVLLPPGRLPYRHAYDMACELCISFKTVHVHVARIKQFAPAFMPVLQTSLKRQQALSYFVSDNYLLDDALGRFLYHQGASRLAALKYLSALDFDEQQTGLLPPEILQKDVSQYGLKPPYITVHSGINAMFPIGSKTPLKCWPTEKWEAFLTLFKQQFPSVQIVQVGGKNSPHFTQADLCLVGKTPVEDLPAVLNGAQLHIDGESGLVQLTRWLQTKAVVLFGPTAPGLFALAKNITICRETCGHCMWLSGPSWHTQCVLQHPACTHLTALSAQEVLEVVRSHMK